MPWYTDGPYTTKKFRLGSVRADPAGNEYIFLQGVGSLAAQDVVVYDEDFVTTRLSTSASYGPVAVALVAADATTEYGWFGLSGEFTADAADVADNAEVYATATAGRIDDAADNDHKITGMVFRSTDNSSAASATVQIRRGGAFHTHDLST